MIPFKDMVFMLEVIGFAKNVNMPLSSTSFCKFFLDFVNLL